MKTLEIIHVRSAGTSLDILSDQIDKSIRGVDDQTEEVSIYRRDGLVTDLAIHIQRTSLSDGEEKSELGLRLASALRAHGSVKHTLWKDLR